MSGPGGLHARVLKKTSRCGVRNTMYKKGRKSRHKKLRINPLEISLENPKKEYLIVGWQADGKKQGVIEASMGLLKNRLCQTSPTAF